MTKRVGFSILLLCPGRKLMLIALLTIWVKNGKRQWETAEALKQAKKYSACLFFCHLVLECLLKVLVVKRTSQEAPFIHNLIRLAYLAELELTDEQQALLKTATTFNLRTRYQDYKLSFHKLADKAYTEKYYDLCNNMRVWLLKKLQKKRPKST